MPFTEADPFGTQPDQPGAKLDAGKVPIVRGAIQYFPLGLAELAKLSLAGAKKYSWGGYLHVPDGYNRYTDALGRHLLKEPFEEIDPDTGLAHDVAVAWNALARLEYRLRRLQECGSDNQNTSN